jgi:ankyrin repeat protein
LLAAEAGNIEEVRRLLNKEVYQDLVADINNKGLDQWTALHFAANEGRIEVVRELVKITDIEIDSYSSIMRAPLHLAAIRGHVNILRLLIESGA